MKNNFTPITKQMLISSLAKTFFTCLEQVNLSWREVMVIFIPLSWIEFHLWSFQCSYWSDMLLRQFWQSISLNFCRADKGYVPGIILNYIAVAWSVHIVKMFCTKANSRRPFVIYFDVNSIFLRAKWWSRKKSYWGWHSTNCFSYRQHTEYTLQRVFGRNTIPSLYPIYIQWFMFSSVIVFTVNKNRLSGTYFHQ